MNKKHSQSLQSPKKEHNPPVSNQKRGEKPQDEQDQFNGDSTEQDLILNDDDEVSVKAMEKVAHGAEGEESENFHDPSGMVGPVHSHIEADNLTDEFLGGEVDLVQQMEKTVDAIHDAYESDGYGSESRI